MNSCLRLPGSVLLGEALSLWGSQSLVSKTGLGAVRGQYGSGTATHGTRSAGYWAPCRHSLILLLVIVVVLKSGAQLHLPDGLRGLDGKRPPL